MFLQHFYKVNLFNCIFFFLPFLPTLSNDISVVWYVYAREEMADFYFFVASQELKKEHVA